MDTKNLSCFIRCYETKSLNRAAADLFITPQGLGKAIDKLENELEVKLFDRTRRGLIPTKAGSHLYASSRELLESYRSLKLELRRIQQSDQRLQIGMACGTMNIFSYDKLSGLLAGTEYENIELEEDFNDSIKSKLWNGELDLAFLTGSVAGGSRLKSKRLFFRRLSAIVYPGHRLYDRKSITMNDLKGEALITLNEKFNIYHSILHRCDELGFVPEITIKSMESSAIYTYAAEGKGIGIDVDIHGDHAIITGLRSIEITDSIPWTISAVYPSDRKHEHIESVLDRLAEE